LSDRGDSSLHGHSDDDSEYDRGDVAGWFGDPEDGDPDDSDAHDSDVEEHAARRRSQRRRRRSGQRHGRWRGRIITGLVVLIIAGLVIAGIAIVPKLLDRFKAKDYAGPGTGEVLVQVKDGQSASAIGATLVDQDVVASKRAFVKAAESTGRAADFRPGYFRLKKHMAAKDAVIALTTPENRVFTKLTIPEGWTTLKALPALAKATGVPLADLQAAAKQLDQLGIPQGYDAKSVEGFLAPATYEFDPNLSATEVLQQLVAHYVDVDKQLDFDSAVGKLGIKPYAALIIASMVEGEAKFDSDRGKVARVILNRLAQEMPLGIDATSLYGAALEGKDPNDVTYEEDSPYNTRNRLGLPPTAIGNPGEASLKAVMDPTPGTWLYYVNGDAEGHLYFATSEADWERARQRCVDNHWGCD
jgi:UPF0755 protein